MARMNTFAAALVLVCCLADITLSGAWYPKPPPTKKSPPLTPARRSPPPSQRSSPPPSPRKSPSPSPKRSPPPSPKRSPPPSPKRVDPSPPRSASPPSPRRVPPSPKPSPKRPPPKRSPNVPFVNRPPPVQPVRPPIADILIGDLNSVPGAADNLIALLQGSSRPNFDDVLGYLGQLSPHVAAYLFRDSRNKGTLFLPTGGAIQGIISDMHLQSLDLMTLLEAYSASLTVVPYHFIPGAVYTADALQKAVAKSDRWGFIVDTLVPNTQLHVLTNRGSLWIMGGEYSAQIAQADLVASSRLIIHVVDSVLLPPQGAQMPLTGPSPPPLPSYPTLLDWLADPANFDATVFRVMTALLPDSFFAGLESSKQVATLFVPGNYTLLLSPSVQYALTSPMDLGAEILAIVLSYHLVPDTALTLDDVAQGGTAVTALGQKVKFGHQGAIPLVNDAKALYGDYKAAKSYVHILTKALEPDWSALSTPPPAGN